MEAGSTRRTILEALRAEPRTLDELSAQLQITRTAVQQHMTALERDGHVRRGEREKTNGRPVQRFAITDKGRAVFPKQYSWFAGLVLSVLANERGSSGLRSVLRELGKSTGERMKAPLEGMPT